jgi:hypothetical protein
MSAGIVTEPVTVEAAEKLVTRFAGDPLTRPYFHGDNMLLDSFPDELAGEVFQHAFGNVKLDWQKIITAMSRRPWNADLKVLCWKIGDSFVKFSNHEKDVYGKVYVQRKVQEVERNDAGAFAEDAEAALRERVIRDKDLKKTYESGRLPAGRLDLRARRYAVKLFLSHLHHVMYENHYGTLPPKPYILAHSDQHVHYLAPPNWPLA